MLSDLLGGVALGDVGLSGIVILVVLMILTDRLVTRKRLEEAREESRAWRTSAETKDAVNAEHWSALSELLSLARTSAHALQEIQAVKRAREELGE